MHQNCFTEPSVLVTRILVSSKKQNGSFTTEYIFYFHVSFVAYVNNNTP